MVELASPGDPLVHGTKEIIEAEGRVEPKYELRVPIAKNLTPKKLRTLKEMGTDSQTQTVVNAVLIYHILGFTKNEIASHLHASLSDVEGIIALPAFQETFHMMFNELLSANSQSLQARIAAFAHRSIDNVMDLADYKPDIQEVKDKDGNVMRDTHYAVPPIVILKANQDILDRTGLSPDVLFGKGEDEGEQMLEIEITHAQDNQTNVKVNVGKK